MLLNHAHHGAEAALALDFKAQPGAQANHFQKICGNAAEIAVGIKKSQGCQGFIDRHFDHRVLDQPALFALGELQFLIGEQQVAAGVPAFGNAFAFTVGHGQQDGVDNVE